MVKGVEDGEQEGAAEGREGAEDEGAEASQMELLSSRGRRPRTKA